MFQFLFRPRRSVPSLVGPALVAWLMACLGMASQAAPPDRDYETVIPASRPAQAAPPDPTEPPGFADSPLVIADHPSAPFPRMRFVLRGGGVMVGQVLGFDGRMYALRLPDGTALARKDLFTAVTPVPAGGRRQAPVRPAHSAAPRPRSPG